MKRILLTLLVSFPCISISGEIKLYDCSGEETGKIEGFISERQLLLECYQHSEKCSAKFFMTEFEASLDGEGKYIDTFAKPVYFEFDPKSGNIQGVTQEPYHYFIGKCVEREKP